MTIDVKREYEMTIDVKREYDCSCLLSLTLPSNGNAQPILKSSDVIGEGANIDLLTEACSADLCL